MCLLPGTWFRDFAGMPGTVNRFMSTLRCCHANHYWSNVFLCWRQYCNYIKCSQWLCMVNRCHHAIYKSKSGGYLYSNYYTEYCNCIYCRQLIFLYRWQHNAYSQCRKFLCMVNRGNYSVNFCKYPRKLCCYCNAA